VPLDPEVLPAWVEPLKTEFRKACVDVLPAWVEPLKTEFRKACAGPEVLPMRSDTRVPFRERSETHAQRQPRPLQGAQRNTRAATAESPSGSAAKHMCSDSRVPFRERTGCHRRSWAQASSEDRFPEGLVPLGPEVLPAWVEPLKTEFRKACVDVLPPPGRRRVLKTEFRMAWCHWVQRCSPPGWNP
jgi:hypothetical protein